MGTFMKLVVNSHLNYSAGGRIYVIKKNYKCAVSNIRTPIRLFKTAHFITNLHKDV